ncbi:NUDIX domain-containing protein [Embleya sp. NPDC020630]|uniref:NUDIX hydrolase n=1 Tax=Embleya sp. NPDC020630 TaxID=3363979 RepID=UPI0037A9F9E4
MSQRGGPYGYGRWHAPSGKLDPGETLTAATAREANEETGVVVDPGHLRLVHTVHHHQGNDAPDRIGFFFEATTWENEPVNREPDKCLRLAWFAVHDLPEDLIPYPEAGLRAYLHGDTGITMHGWPHPARTTPETEPPGPGPSGFDRTERYFPAGKA